MRVMRDACFRVCVLACVYAFNSEYPSAFVSVCMCSYVLYRWRVFACY